MSSFHSSVAKFFLLVAACFFMIESQAQESVVNENNAPSLKWYQLHTTHFRILYPLGYEQQAQRMANTLEYIHAPESKTMGASPRKISLILQNQTSISNGFVSITPRRSEFYGMPSQNYNFIGNNDWLNLLATHEYRHMVQFQHATRGFNRLVYYAFGNYGLSAMSYLGAPQWFWEGDAVATETAFTNSGRGRIPNFDLLFRTNLMEGRTFNYHKQYLRSYRHNIPDYYKLGYHMVSYLRRKTNNPEIWENVTRRSWATSFVPFTFSIALKKEAGMYVKDLYTEMAADLKKQWQAQLDTTRITAFEKIQTRHSNAYTDYRFPQEMEGGGIIVQKSGIGDIEQLVLLNGNQETTIYTQGVVNDAAMLSATNSRIVWNEFRYDPRWRMKTYSAIVGYDMGSKVKHVIAKKGRYAAAALSSDGYKVATVETSTDYQTKLVVLDYISGNQVMEFKNPDNDFISMPRWTSDGKNIVALKTNKKGKALVLFTLATQEEKLLTEYTDENMGHPVPFGKYILYNSPVSGIDNIYALDTESGKRFQITSSKYGSYNPSLSRDGKTIYYNEQGKDGMDVVKINFNPGEWKAWKQRKQPDALFAHLAAQEASNNFLADIPDSTYKAKRYSRLKGMINPYTWGAYLNNNLSQATIGISSRDLLSTTTIKTGYNYDINEKTGDWTAAVSYQGFYPIIDAQIVTGERQLKTSLFDREVKFSWKETGFIGGLRIPILLTKSKYFTEIEVGNSVGVTSISSFQNEVTKDGIRISSGTDRIVPANDTLFYSFNDRANRGQLIYNQFIFSFTSVMKQSRRDFNPKYAQLLTFENYETPYGGNFRGNLTAIRAIVYFPGLFKHHSFYFRGGFQTTFSSIELNTYQFRNRIFKPRGFAYPRDSKFLTLSGNYAFPIAYPDIAIGPLINIQRIKTNLFCDYGTGEGRSYFYRFKPNQLTDVYFSNSNASYLSVGAEVTVDINVMRFLPQFEIGLRATYLTPNRFFNSGTVLEFLIGNIPL